MLYRRSTCRSGFTAIGVAQTWAIAQPPKSRWNRSYIGVASGDRTFAKAIDSVGAVPPRLAQRNNAVGVSAFIAVEPLLH
ncbi:MAG: hypothetical protein EAZ30_07630 [Betaproteobacteria bacterium]|nr:MAG: hypothetical protein EAZ30_07630 [Betaproteobacteria bacterium]